MKKFLKLLCRISSSLLPVLLTAWHALATADFARQYDLKCSNCHTEIPKLTEYGQSFRSNGFAIKEPPPKLPEKPKTDSTRKDGTPAADGESSGSAVKEPTTMAEPAPPPLPPPPEIIYTWKTADGVIHFADKPRRLEEIRGGEESAIKPRHRYAQKKSWQHRTAIDRKQAAAVNTDIATASQGKSSLCQSTADTSRRIPRQRKSALPADFTACMEEVFARQPQPADGDEAMNMFYEAEEQCADHPLRQH